MSTDFFAEQGVNVMVWPARSPNKSDRKSVGYNVQRGIPERETIRFCIRSNLGSHQSVEEHTARNIGDLYRLHAAPLHRSPQNAGKKDTLQV